LCGTEFKDMVKRAEKAKEKEKQRIEKKKLKEQQEKLEVEKMEKKKIEEDEKLRKEMLLSKSWKELEKEHQKRRADRILSRKKTIAVESTYPTPALKKSVDIWLQCKNTDPVPVAAKKKAVTPDPQVVRCIYVCI
jgi:hypothetical protein